MDTITIRRPDDWHVHFRSGTMLKAVVPFTARQFGRAIVMPNLTPPVTTATRPVKSNRDGNSAMRKSQASLTSVGTGSLSRPLERSANPSGWR